MLVDTSTLKAQELMIQNLHCHVNYSAASCEWYAWKLSNKESEQSQFITITIIHPELHSQIRRTFPLQSDDVPKIPRKMFTLAIFIDSPPKYLISQAHLVTEISRLHPLTVRV